MENTINKTKAGLIALAAVIISSWVYLMYLIISALLKYIGS